MQIMLRYRWHCHCVTVLCRYNEALSTCIDEQIIKTNLKATIQKHQWSSGRTVPCHGTDPGSIPGWCIFFFHSSILCGFMNHAPIISSNISLHFCFGSSTVNREATDESNAIDDGAVYHFCFGSSTINRETTDGSNAINDRVYLSVRICSPSKLQMFWCFSTVEVKGSRG